MTLCPHALMMSELICEVKPISNIFYIVEAVLNVKIAMGTLYIEQMMHGMH